MKKGCCLFICLTFLSFISAQTNNSYVRKGSVGKKVIKEDTLSRSAFAFIPISNWVGERFIFLPKHKDLQQYGYQSFHVDYDKYVGRIAKVISIDKSDFLYKVTLKMEDDGAELTATADYSETINGLAPIADIDSARSRWLNKTLWSKQRELSTYDEEKNELQSVMLRRYSPVKVIDIVAGWYDHKPVRFILQTEDGNEGYVDLNLSNTNVSANLWEYSQFDEEFLTKDPRKTHHWTKKVWDAIEGGKVFIGMTSDQAKFSWGLPDNINRTHTGSRVHEQWVYSSGSYLYFENGLLTSIQN